MDFSTLGLASAFIDKLQKNGINSPTNIQREVFPAALEGKDLRILSKTGTGKTLSYVLPIAQKYLLSEDGSLLTQGLPKILVIVPTRELAFQVESTFELLGYKNFTDVIVGGEAENTQIKSWQTAVVGIATPGRILDLLERNMIDVRQLKCIVFDEADRLIDMGFVDDIRKIWRRLPKKLHVLFASATMNLTVDEIAYEFGVNLERIGIEEDELTVTNLEHKIAFVGDDEKFHALANYLKRNEGGRAIVFSNYRERAHDVSRRLHGLGWAVEALSAQLNQDQRNKITERYRNGEIKVLIASDLASRGLDFLDIDYVVNFDLPEDPAVYVHRVGRTARAGKKGEALSLVGFNDSFLLEKLESFLGSPIPRINFEAGELSGRLPRLGPGPQHQKKDRPADSHQDRSYEPRRDRPREGQGPRPQGRAHSPQHSRGASAPYSPRNPSASPQARAPHSSPSSSTARPREAPLHKPTVAKTPAKVGFLKKLMEWVGLSKNETTKADVKTASPSERGGHRPEGNREQGHGGRSDRPRHRGGRSRRPRRGRDSRPQSKS
jgi:ATP-dependent RNA helicase RhlE